MKRDSNEWGRILVQCGVIPSTAAKWAPVFAAVIGDETFSAGEKDLQAFLGQVLHESTGMNHEAGRYAPLERTEENLGYSAKRLMAVWPRRFPTMAIAQLYAGEPEKLANKVYGGRLGNTAPGDGWKYRGRGLIQVTGRANYELVERTSGLRVISNPDLLAQPLPALQASIAWWEHNVPDEILGDPEAVTLEVNGGAIGLAHREQLTELVGHALA